MPLPALFFIRLVELGDTASPSESPHGYESTCVVVCFVLASAYSGRERNYKLPWLNVGIVLATSLNLFPLYDNFSPTEPWTKTSLLIIRHKLACMQHAQFSCFLHLLILTVFNRHASYLLTIRLSFVSPNLYYYSILLYIFTVYTIKRCKKYHNFLQQKAIFHYIAVKITTKRTKK